MARRKGERRCTKRLGSREQVSFARYCGVKAGRYGVWNTLILVLQCIFAQLNSAEEQQAHDSRTLEEIEADIHQLATDAAKPPQRCDEITRQLSDIRPQRMRDFDALRDNKHRGEASRDLGWS